MFLRVYHKLGHDKEKKNKVENMANLEANLDNRISNTVWQETVWDHPKYNPIPNMFLV
jgi:hypothetical protein